MATALLYVYTQTIGVFNIIFTTRLNSDSPCMRNIHKEHNLNVQVNNHIMLFIFVSLSSLAGRKREMNGEYLISSPNSSRREDNDFLIL